MAETEQAPPPPVQASAETISPLEEYACVEPLVREPMRAGSAYFLINRRWYTEWLQWVGHPCVQSPKTRPVDGPILPEELDTNADTESPLISASKRTRTRSWTKDRPGRIDNSELLEEGSVAAIKRNLDERADYEIVPEDAWNLLCSWYGGGPPIKRRAIQLPSGGVQVELYGLQLLVHKSSNVDAAPLEIIESKCTSIKELKTSLCEEMGLDPTKTRIWDYFNNKHYDLLEKNLDRSLEGCRMVDQNPILLEEQNEDGTWPEKETTHNDYLGGSAVTSTSSTQYGQSMSADVPSVGEPVQRGAVGLQNLGNTCFMNSSIQCLANMPPLREYFVSEEYKESLNRQAYKTQGKLAESFAQLLGLMWREDTTRVAPRNFKFQVGQFAEQFSGYGQQDSMELIEYVLDGIKEDTNLIKGQKPYVEVKEAEGRTDEEVASEAMENYRMRSDSRVDDLFVGLFKSVVRCPAPQEKCGRCSVTFDPFLSAKLPLVSQAEQRHVVFTITVIRERAASLDRPAVQQVQVKVFKDVSVKSLIEEAVKEVEDLETKRCVLLELWNKKVHKFFEDTEAVESIRPEDFLLLFEVTDAKAFQVPAEQRWGTNYSVSRTLATVPEAPQATASSSSSCGVVVHHRQVPPKPTTTWGSSSRSRELHGLPMLFAVPKNASGRVLCAEVGRGIGELVFAKDGPRPSWKVYKVDKWSPTVEGSLIDPEDDEAQDFRDTREYCAVEWEEGASLPASLSREDFKPTPAHTRREPEQTLEALLQSFIEDEQLGPDDAWYCRNCKECVEAWKRLEFHVVPPILVLQLKRFRYTRWSRERLNTPVHFPMEGLDLSPFATASSKNAPDLQVMVYDLAAMSKHIGSLGGGHYVAYCRSSEDGEWYYFDDGSVRSVSVEEVEADKVGAYVLFYIRRDYRPTSFGPPAVQ